MDLFAPRHLLIILVVVLLVFGTRKLKTLGSDLGASIRGFKKAMREGESQDALTHDLTASGIQPPPVRETAEARATGEVREGAAREAAAARETERV